MTASKAKPQTIDEYLARVRPDQRAALQKLRKTIRSILPRAEECISYGVPAFRLDRHVIVWCAAAANHCSFFPGGAVEEFESELADYQTSKGTVRFQPDHPLPASLVRKLIKARLHRIAERATRRPARRKTRA
jgi:uncharacterized protein YdhG (YjbR/CyaY superfamily)